MENKKLKIVELNINSLSKDGHGVGSYLNSAGRKIEVEVPFTMPGDDITVSLMKKRKGLYQGRLETIINPSSKRINPVCIHFGTCGGCRWQHISYDDQLHIKEQFVKKIFDSILTNSTHFYSVLPCLPPWNYRNKMEFTFSSDKAKNRYLGLIIQGSRGKVFNLQECYLPGSWFAEAVKIVRSWWESSGLDAYHPSNNTGSLRTLILREGLRSNDRLVMLTVSGNPEFALNQIQIDSFKKILIETIKPQSKDQNLSIFLRIQQIAKNSPTQFFEMLLEGPDHIRETLHIENNHETHSLTFKISPSAFFQPNTRQAERLYSRALELANIPKDAIVYDLYCGTGTLGICAAKRAKKVIGIELSPESSLDARENAKKNNIENIEILTGDVGQVLGRLNKEKDEKPDVVMVDPPRVGLDSKAIANILELRPPILLYISCNPSTQATNIKEFINAGYKLNTVQPVDQFPHTVHIENIAVLILPQ